MGDEVDYNKESCLYSNPSMTFDPSYKAYLISKGLRECVACSDKSDCSKKIMAKTYRKLDLITDEVNLFVKHTKSLSSRTATPLK